MDNEEVKEGQGDEMTLPKTEGTASSAQMFPMGEDQATETASGSPPAETKMEVSIPDAGDQNESHEDDTVDSDVKAAAQAAPRRVSFLEYKQMVADGKIRARAEGGPITTVNGEVLEVIK